MTRDDYCLKICGGKCCVFRVPDEGVEVRCPRLTENGSCSVYQARYGELGHEPLVQVGAWPSTKYRRLDGAPAMRPFWCGRIEDILAAGSLSPEVEAGCCYAHPELLNEPMEDR